jgi:hemerythrin-like domain-containing protein
MSETILNLMINHHALIEAMFAVFRDDAKGKSKRTSASLSELTWEMQKHFFVEESAIFSIPLVQMKEIGVFTIITQLRSEHVVMLKSLKYFADNLPTITGDDLEEFFNLLDNHRKIEEINLYPRLDKQLQLNQKKDIIERIDEIPITKS